MYALAWDIAGDIKIRSVIHMLSQPAEQFEIQSYAKTPCFSAILTKSGMLKNGAPKVT
jgi:hypothetical protein